VDAKVNLTSTVPLQIFMLSPGGPAERSGKVMVGDALVSVSGITTRGRDVHAIIGMLVGEQGSWCPLVLRRDVDGVHTEVHVNLQRAANVCLGSYLSKTPSQSKLNQFTLTQKDDGMDTPVKTRASSASSNSNDVGSPPLHDAGHRRTLAFASYGAKEGVGGAEERERDSTRGEGVDSGQECEIVQVDLAAAATAASRSPQQNQCHDPWRVPAAGGGIGGCREMRNKIPSLEQWKSGVIDNGAGVLTGLV
jgi:hypothetical protein